MNDKLLLYMHVPKTGGSSFTQAIIENCPNIFHYRTISTDLLNEMLDKMDAVCGHFVYGIHRDIKRQYQYVTMLRHPYQRALSFFYFKYKDPNYLFSYNKDLTFEEYVLDPANDAEYCNLQSRMILGHLDDFYPNYQKVCSHLTQNFTFVGLTERYDISLFLFMQKINWKLQHFPKINVTPNRPIDLNLSKKAAEVFFRKNEIDRKVYEYAYRKFNEQVLGLTSDQAKELKAYLREARKKPYS